ncbi:helix-turn-helix domain-containing protein [Clostridium sp. 'deep sea']|uniref:helix-turn-helix domain-containing protein n=1 Tax=Clostridium sp. 'deep sea' TaxID=2779445 RepID=UPI0018965467|nr:helix-turn-helix domain-containing protein [Clostridium sp. 'deep sea']QOR34243.1 helix-turn-helix domain-containing protein [Clostridium sp. 'deep sea']
MLYELNIKEYKPLRAQIISKLKADGLSIRTIAKLLNINRNIVQRVKMEDN